MNEKRFRNTAKGRSRLPDKIGEYKLLDVHGNEVSEWKKADDLKWKIIEEHYSHKEFSFILIRS